MNHAERTGFVLFAHGSRVETANESVRAVAGQLSRSNGFPVEAAFLECAQPDLAGAVGALAAREISRVIVIPYFLTLGTHLQRDLPVLVREAALRYPEIELASTAPLDGHPALLTVLLDRADAALTGGTA